MAEKQGATYLVPKIFNPFPNIVAVQSTRLGGYSQAPFGSQNLGLFTKDDTKSVARNRQQFFRRLGFSQAQTAGSHQVHSDRVLLVDKPGQFEGYDALVSRETNILLTIATADCTPVLMYDPQTQVCAAAHAGWRGTVNEILLKTLGLMERAFSVQPKDCFAYIGPCIDRCSFEVDADVADHFSPDCKEWDEAKGKFFVDLKKANQSQLISAGLSAKNIAMSPYSTYVDNDLFYSYRKENGITGRMLTVIGRRD